MSGGSVFPTLPAIGPTHQQGIVKEPANNPDVSITSS